MKQGWYKTEFVKTIPKHLRDGILYVSLEYNIAMHRCACGCGSEISTPLSRQHGWIFTYDGENSSLSPSIGNGAYQCKSHYWMTEGQIKWLKPMEQRSPIIVQNLSWWERVIKRLK